MSESPHFFCRRLFFVFLMIVLSPGLTVSAADLPAPGHPWASDSCGTPPASVLKALQSPKGSQTDCSLDQTAIEPEYNPTTALKVPIIVHVIHKTDGTGMLAASVIHDQIEVLNEDFNALGDASDGAASNIHFVRAGVQYHEDDDWFDCPYPCDAMKDDLNVDPNLYLNLYITNAGGAGFRGWSTFAQVSAATATDGVVLDWRATANTGAEAPYDRGHTLAHQVGHYLGLLHTYAPEPAGCPDENGSPSCYTSDGDLICDTKPEFEAHFGCSSEPTITCFETSPPGSIDPIGNLMNQPDDDCIVGFTAEQVNRMRCTLLNYRFDLTDHALFWDGFESGDTSAWDATVFEEGFPKHVAEQRVGR